MKKFMVEFGFGENFEQVQEWHTMDGLDVVMELSAEDAAKWASCTDGLENALFMVYELIRNECGVLEPSGRPVFCFPAEELG